MNRHKIYPNLVLLRYDQLESDFSFKEVNQARGVIFDELDNWSIVSYPFSKFYNSNESRAAILDWNNTSVCTKEDGSLCHIYQYDNKWHVSTSGTPDASGEVNGWKFTFSDMFWKFFQELGMSLPPIDPNNPVTIIFELCAQANRVVVNHTTPRIVLIGARDLRDMRELSRPELQELSIRFNWELVKQWPVQTLEEVIALANTLDPIKQEGFVACDKSFNRVKIKSLAYLALHSLKDGFGPKRVISLVREETEETWLETFPEFQELYNEILGRYNILVHMLETEYAKNMHIESQKEFALAIKDVPFSGALFSLRAGKTSSIKDYLKTININSLVDYLT